MLSQHYSLLAHSSTIHMYLDYPPYAVNQVGIDSLLTILSYPLACSNDDFVQYILIQLPPIAQYHLFIMHLA